MLTWSRGQQESAEATETAELVGLEEVELLHRLGNGMSLLYTKKPTPIKAAFDRWEAN